MTGPQGMGPLTPMATTMGHINSAYDTLMATLGLMWYDHCDEESALNAVPMGGTITTAGGVRQHKMTITERFWTGKTSALAVNMLGVGSGGAGGGQLINSTNSQYLSGGGGGAIPGTYNGNIVDGAVCTVAPAAATNQSGNQGSDGASTTVVQVDGTSIGTYVGGSGGGGTAAGQLNGRSGTGGGGGGAIVNPASSGVGSGTGGAGTGGAGNGANPAAYAGNFTGRSGGGGGATGNASTPITNGAASNGGAGYQWTTASGGDNLFYGVGGGGSNGGTGGAGEANTGNGGNGAQQFSGSVGGSGVVIFRFAYP